VRVLKIVLVIVLLILNDGLSTMASQVEKNNLSISVFFLTGLVRDLSQTSYIFFSDLTPETDNFIRAIIGKKL
jgi:hypothetical protein